RQDGKGRRVPGPVARALERPIGVAEPRTAVEGRERGAALDRDDPRRAEIPRGKPARLDVAVEAAAAHVGDAQRGAPQVAYGADERPDPRARAQETAMVHEAEEA